MRSNPLPDDDGIHFKIFNPSETNTNASRSVKTTADRVPKSTRYETKVHSDI